MKYVNGAWYHRGRSYATLREALAAVWPQRPGQKKATLVLAHQSGKAEQTLMYAVSVSYDTGNGGSLQV